MSNLLVLAQKPSVFKCIKKGIFQDAQIEEFTSFFSQSEQALLSLRAHYKTVAGT